MYPGKFTIIYQHKNLKKQIYVNFLGFLKKFLKNFSQHVVRASNNVGNILCKPHKPLFLAEKCALILHN